MSSADTRAAEELARDLQKLHAAIDPEGADALNKLGVDFVVLARGLVHVVSGVLQNSLHPEGPFHIGEGTLEMVISPSPANYAIEEVKRGGDHDYVSQTLEAGQPQLDAVALELGRKILSYLRGAY